MPLIRTIARNLDTSYIIGVFVFPDRITYPKDVALLESEMNRLTKKNANPCFLSHRQLKKINVNKGNGRSVIYNLDVTIPFKKKYYKCKVLAAEDKDYNYFALYYFYNNISEKKIMNIIRSQLGKIKFK